MNAVAKLCTLFLGICILSPLAFSGEIEIKLDRAAKLRKAAARCEERVASGQLSECWVRVSFEGNRKISSGEAYSLAGQLESEAAAMQAPPPVPVESPSLPDLPLPPAPVIPLEDQVARAEARIAELRLDISKTQVALKRLSKDLMNNSSEFETWGNTVDEATRNTLEKSKEYVLSLFVDQILVGKLDRDFTKNVLYKKLDELVNAQDPAVKAWLGQQYLERKVTAESMKQTLTLLQSSPDLTEHVAGLFGAITPENGKELDSLILAGDLLNSLNRTYKDQLGVLHKLEMPLQHAKMIGEAYTDVAAICYSWFNINELTAKNDDYIREVNVLSGRMEYAMKEMHCLEGCVKGPDASCMERCQGRSRLSTPPPELS